MRLPQNTAIKKNIHIYIYKEGKILEILPGKHQTLGRRWLEKKRK